MLIEKTDLHILVVVESGVPIVQETDSPSFVPHQVTSRRLQNVEDGMRSHFLFEVLLACDF